MVSLRFRRKKQERKPERIFKNINVVTEEETTVELYRVKNPELDIKSVCLRALTKIKRAAQQVPFKLVVKDVDATRVWFCENCRFVLLFEEERCPYCGARIERGYGEAWNIPMVDGDISPVNGVPAVFIDRQPFAYGETGWDSQDIVQMVSQLNSEKTNLRRIREFERMKRFLYADYFLIRAHFVQFTGDIKHPIEFVLIPKHKVFLNIAERKFSILPGAWFLPATDPVMRAIQSMGMRVEDLTELGFTLEGREVEVVEFPTSEKARVLEEYLAKTRGGEKKT